VQMMYKAVQITDDPSCLPRSMAYHVQFDTGAFHKYKVSSLHKLTREGDAQHVPLTPHTIAYGDRVLHPTHGPGMVLKVPDLVDEETATALSEPTHFLLYLNVDTFVGEEGKQLANEVRAAMEGELPIIMPHEIDPARRGCQFERFFSTTPPDLIRNGLYKKLALPCFPGEQDRRGSMATIAKVGLNFSESKKEALRRQSSAGQLDRSKSKSRGTFPLGSFGETSIIRAPSFQFQFRKPTIACSRSAGEGVTAGAGTATGGDDAADVKSKPWVMGWLGSMSTMAKIPRRGQMVKMVTATPVRGETTATPIQEAVTWSSC